MPYAPSPLSLIERIVAFGDQPAVVDPSGTWTYAELDRRAKDLARVMISSGVGRGDRVALLCRPGRDFVIAVLATWWAGAMAVPLHPAHPAAELGYVLDDAAAGFLITSDQHADAAEALAQPRYLTVVTVDPGAGDEERPPLTPPVALTPPDSADAALVIHTSGTTGRPKGVVHTHASVQAQIEGMVEAWAWSADDRILLVLPLNHVHGIVNVTLCPLWVGATAEAPGGFDPVETWERLASGRLTIFMAVPTIYARLLATWADADEAAQARWSTGAESLRLMVSGSAALPVTVLDEWRRITGQLLLERYGMTEVGMALGNTLAHRVAGHVGVPFPGVEARIVDDVGSDVADGQPGELLLRGPQLFAGYWNRPDETTDAFTDGWFRTGDVGVATPDGYRLLGRESVDILKTGGEKVSALEIEEVLRTHRDVVDCAVVGLPDVEWGQRVVAAVVTRAGTTIDGPMLRRWGKERLAPAKVPTRYLFVDELPRNAMGKVTKPAVRELFVP